VSQPLRAYLLKGFLSAGDLIGRWFCFPDRAAPRGWLHPGLAYGPHPCQKLDVIEQEGRAPPQSVVAYLHGGGWTRWSCTAAARDGAQAARPRRRCGASGRRTGDAAGRWDRTV